MRNTISRRNAIIAGAAVTAAVAGMLAGCGSSAGAEATCDQYRSGSSSAKTKIVEALISTYGGKYGDENTPAKRAEYKLSIAGFCALNTGDTKVSGIYGNGGE